MISATAIFAQGVTVLEPAQGTSLLQYLEKGGVIGWIIVGLSVVALGLVVVHSIQIRRAALLPPAQVAALNDMLSAGRADSALEYCMMPENDSFLTRTISPGLTRFLKSPFGAFEIKTAIEEAGAEQTARLYRTTDGLGIIGNIAPLLGLLGTVVGMIGAFDSVATSAVNDANFRETIAGNISLALITTMEGLVVAIPCVILFTVFRNRIDAIAAETGQHLDAMVLNLEESTGSSASAVAPGVPRMAGSPAQPTPPRGNTEG